MDSSLNENLGKNTIEKVNLFTEYIPEINTLRGIAILAVLINHLNKDFLPGGFFGVDLFFVVSGYVVSIALAKCKITNFRQYIIYFYSNRLKRILPALFVCIAFTAIFSILFIPPSWLSYPIPKTGIFGVFGIANIALMQDGNGYFSPRSDMNPFTQLWSLGVEEQFYFIFPIIFFYWLRSNKSKKINFSNYYNFSNYVLVILTITSLIYSINSKGSLDDRDYYSIFSRFWEIGAGGLLYQIHTSLRMSLFDFSRNHQKFLKTNLILFIISIFILIFSFFLLDINSAPIPGSIPIVISTILLIDCFRSDGKRNNQILRNRHITNSLDFLGKISYSTYLYHWPVIVLLKWTIGLGSILNYFLAIFLSLALGSLSFKYIETPFRKITINSLRNKCLIIGLSILSAIGLSSLLQVIYSHQHLYSLTKAAKREHWVAWETSILEDELPRYDFQGKSIFVIGDSHAGSYGGMNLFLKEKSNLNYYLYQIAPCNIGNFKRPIDEIKCKDILDNIFKEIKSNSNKGDIVFIANLRLYRYRDQWNVKAIKEEDLFSFINNESTKNLGEKGELQLNSYIEKFTKMGLNILLDYPKPVYPSPPFRCVDWFNKNNPICKEGFTIDLETHKKFSVNINEIIDRTSAKYKNVYTWDPARILCEKNICSAERKGEFLYFDGDHITAIGNKYLYIDYVKKLKQIYDSNK